MVEADINLKNGIPEHWSLYLRCTVCFGYLQDPFTLECGHTFCKKCLKRLGEIAREDNAEVHVRRVALSCPACRHSFPARLVLSDRMRTSIVIKHLVEHWKRECKMLAASSAVTLRSICTQTDTCEIDTGETKLDNTSPSDNLHEVVTVRHRPLEQYCEAVMKRVSESTNDNDLDAIDTSSAKAIALYPPGFSRHHPDYRLGESDSASESGRSSGSSNSSSTTSLPEIFGQMNIPRLTFTRCSPGHFLLMLVWCMYSVIIVGLAETFLPYVILFTLFFFLVILG